MWPREVRWEDGVSHWCCGDVNVGLGLQASAWDTSRDVLGPRALRRRVELGVHAYTQECVLNA